MEESLTLGRNLGRRTLSFITGVGIIIASILTIKHFFDANYPASIWEGSFCDISAFFNCDSSAYSSISAIKGVPMGYFGVLVGGLVSLGALLPSAALERTNKTVALVNLVGVVALLLYSLTFAFLEAIVVRGTPPVTFLFLVSATTLGTACLGAFWKIRSGLAQLEP